MGDAASDAAAARVGRTLRGRWRLDALIGVGGMADVYAATHCSGARVAFKVLRPGASTMPEVNSAPLRMPHRNVVRILDDDVDDEGNVCVVMELLEGETLRARARAEGGTLAQHRVLRLLDQALVGLASLHQAGIVHRDIKPGNIFLTFGGQVKIIDLGLASLSATTSEFVPVTLAGTVMGTPEFMSPEQAGARWPLVGAHSDLWSLGATAFTLLSGQVVHAEWTLPEMLVAIMEGPARSLASTGAGAHPALVDVVDRALKGAADERWSSAHAMRAAVRAAFSAIYGRPLSRPRLPRFRPAGTEADRS